MSAATACPQCGTPAVAGDRFCEGCGEPLPRPGVEAGAGQGGSGSGAGTDGEAGQPSAAEPAQLSEATVPVLGRAVARPRPRSCTECGGEIDDDGYCTQCGAKAPRERDHLELAPAGWVAAVSDRGVRHHRNEDAAAALAEPGRAALVVCDGVSSSADSDVASLAAAKAAAKALGTGSVGLATGAARLATLGSRMTEAARAASAAVAAAPPDGTDNPPSYTFVAAAVQEPAVVVGVVGDSRAYWLPDDADPVVLTVDDSVSGQQIAAGRARADAEAGPLAHTITRWLGVDSPDETPRLTSFEVDRPGWLLLCSDGLWNYCSEATAVRAVLDGVLDAGPGQRPDETPDERPDETPDPARRDPLATAAALVAWANEQGGHDNITVVLARLGRTPGAGEGAEQA